MAPFLPQLCLMSDRNFRGAAVRSLLIDDAAAVLNVSRRTVYYRIRAGRLQTIRTRCGSQRVLVSSIQALLGRDADEGDPGAPASRAPDRGPLQAEALPLQIEPLA
jgi:excisionase family DNA binding protein